MFPNHFTFSVGRLYPVSTASPDLVPSGPISEMPAIRMQQGARLVFSEHHNHAELWVMCTHLELSQTFGSNCQLVTKLAIPIYPSFHRALKRHQILLLPLPAWCLTHLLSFPLYLKLKKTTKGTQINMLNTYIFQISYSVFSRHNKHAN